jgi:tetratricopeptide (TPR) repeat protein
MVKDLETAAFSQFGGWSGILKRQGPIDDPTFRDDLGAMFTKAQNYRQAIEEYDRVKALTPWDLRIDLQLAQVYIYVQTFTNSLAQLLPWNEGYTKAIQHADIVLKSFPDQSDALFMKSVALIQTKSYDQALISLNKLLAEPQQTNNYLAMLNRAIAYYKVGNLKAAKPDYEEVGRVYPQMYQVYYGLGQIADHDNNTSEAIHNYELYLTKAPPNTEEAQSVSIRLKALKGGP